MFRLKNKSHNQAQLRVPNKSYYVNYMKPLLMTIYSVGDLPPFTMCILS